MKITLRILWILSVAWGAGQTSFAEPIYFVQISDTHIGAGGTAATRHAIASINRLPMPIACVVHTGDITGDKLAKPGIAAHATKLLSTLKPPLLTVPGNHDILKKSQATTLAAYTNAFGSLIQSRQVGPLRFISVFTEPLADAVTMPGFDPLKALEQELAKAPGQATIICHHSPSANDFFKNKMHRGWPTKQAEAWRKLLERYPVKAILCGHFHRSEQHWLGDIPIYVGPAVVNYWGRTPAYRLYSYEDGRLSYHTIYLPPKK